MTDLRKAAKGELCQVRIPTICNNDRETVVLAHFRLLGISGLGIKSPDLLGAWCCSACHTYVDQSKEDYAQLAFAHGVFRTQAKLIERHLVKW